MTPDPHTAAEEAVDSEVEANNTGNNTADEITEFYRAAAVRREEVIQRVRQAREELLKRLTGSGWEHLLSLLDQALQEKR